MKHPIFALILLLAVAGCGSNSTHIPAPGSPIGPFVFMVGQTSNNVFTFKGGADGVISGMASAPTGAAPSAVLVESLSTTQMNLFVTSSATGTVLAFNLDPVTGMANPTGISAAVGANPIAIALRPALGIPSPAAPADNGSIYILNQGSNSISGFRITDASGHLAALPGSPYPTQPNPQAIAILTSGTAPTSFVPVLYVANGTQGTISGFQINSDGSLAEITGSPFAAGANITALAAAGAVLLASDAGANKITGFKIQNNGALTATPGLSATTGSQPGALTVGFNNFVYVANRGSNNVSGFKFDFASSSLTPLPGSPFAAGTTPIAIGSTRPLQLYVANQGSSNISGFNIDQNTGALTPIAGSPFPTPAPPASIQTLFIMNVD